MRILTNPDVMQNHATAISLAVSQVQQNQDKMNTTLSNPGLLAAGKDWIAITEAANKLDRDLSALNVSHSQLSKAVLDVLAKTSETDANSARGLHV